MEESKQMEKNDVNQPQSSHALEPPPPLQQQDTNQMHQVPNQSNNGQKIINGNSCLQQSFFTWIYQLLSKAQDEDLQINSIPALPPHLRAEYEFEAFLSQRKALKQKGLLKILLDMFGGEIIKLVLLCVLVEVFYLSYPILIRFNIDFIQNHKDNTRYGILLFSLTILASFFYNLTFTNVKYRFNSLGVKLSTHLNLLIYHKSLNYSMIGNKGFSESDIIGYSQVDADNMMYVGSRLAYFVFGIIEIFAGFGLLYWFVGLAFIAGVVVLVFVSLLTFIISSCSVELTQKALNSRDQRLSVTSELLSMIRFVKINAMEKFFYKRIQEERQYQLMSFRKKGIIEIVLVFFYCITAPLFLTATIVTYFIINDRISSSEIFTTLMIATVFEVTAQKMPKACSELIAVLRSIQRIDAFLKTPDIDTSNYQHSPNDNQNQTAVKIENGYFLIKQHQSNTQQFNQSPQAKEVNNGPVEFDIIKNEANPQNLASDRRMVQAKDNLSKNESIILKGINLNIEKGKLYLIYGDIGSGKSVLLLSILNQLNKKQQSRLQVNGKVAYVSQKPWILQGTVEQNIYFTFEKDEHRLNEAIKYACLQDDVRQFRNGVKCEIGENGINLSGGQKFRVDLARSLYSQSDIYLYDDILSAVDIHVGTFLIDETVLGYLKGKTVIMATHAIRFANKADYIILMKHGQIVACDKYSEIAKIPEFREVQMKIQERQRESGDKDPKQVKSIIHSIIEEEQIDIEIAASSERPSASQEDSSAIQRLILPQDQEKGSVATQIFKEYVRLNGGYICFLGSIMLCFFLYSGLQTASSIFLTRWSQDSKNLTNLYIFIILTFSANFFIFLQAIILVFAGVKQGRQVHNNIVKGLIYASLTNFFNRVPLGRILNRLGKDLKALDESIAPTFSSFLVSFFRILSAIFIAIYTSTPFAVIPIVLVAIIFIKVRFFYLAAQNKLIRLQKVTNTPLVVSFTNGIRGAPSIRCYKSSETFLKAHIQFVNNYRRVLFNHFAAAGWFLLILVYAGFIVNMFVIGYCMFGPNTNPAYIGLLLSTILNLNDQVYSFVLQQADFQTQLISLQRLYQITQLPPEKRYVQYCREWSQAEDPQINFLNSGSIEFKHASVRYRHNLPKVIKNLTCKIKSGDKIGIVGRTGSGKTTILNTIIGVSQLTQGQIFIDGKRIDDIPLKNLRREITVIDQQPVLFNSTFRQNLDVFNRYQDQELLKIARQCSAYEIIEKRGGLYGKVSNDSLSAGQKQLICICRALLKNSKIVLIDQATANIDVVHDQIIQKVISQKFADKTLLTIAHRLSTLKDYDKIMVLQAGKLLEFGSPRELLQLNGIYSEMINKYGASQLSSIFK